MPTLKLWQQEYECEFIDVESYEAIISRTAIDKCLNNPPVLMRGKKCAFIDFGGGVAETVIARMEGNKILEPIAWVDDNAYANAGKIIHECSTWNIEPSSIFGDYGYGKQIMDFMAEMGWAIQQVNNGSPSNEKIFANTGAEIWYDAKKRIEQCDVILPRDEITLQQMTNRGIRYKTGGKIGIETKESMFSRGVKSPDRADAVCGVISRYKYIQHGINQPKFFNSQPISVIDNERKKLMRGFFVGN